ncbi:MAG: hypothetical protein AMXMBFR64_50590 [Myxococcales bacterium]
MTTDAAELDYTPARGEAALAAVREAAEALAPGDVQRISAGLLNAGLRAIGVARRVIGDEALAARFERLPPDELSPEHLARLSDLGWAAVHLHQQALRAEAVATSAKLPVKLVEEAVSRRSRMLAAATYYLGDLPETGAEIASIRSGGGHTDLALDLQRLAVLYDAHRSVLESDKKYWRATDASDARRDGDEILETIAGTRLPGMPADLPERVFTLLRVSYGEVRSAALWLLRGEPGALDGFPSLHAVDSKPKAAPKPAPAPAPTPAEQPALA